ncbi:hypothetical protein BCR44DRAFT_1433767 [Catenaria anguillulae PL171]|uniref:Uncharacterized protein n=1 Tax=Catenaria anguillulae PL171 TaxID=765915 RepID=A0A1Y2HLV5_9FUNG|nr:hypothetical protein BCR44DRAFT_1433767 [Catenaria anguillulae PL171]
MCARMTSTTSKVESLAPFSFLCPIVVLPVSSHSCLFHNYTVCPLHPMNMQSCYSALPYRPRWPALPVTVGRRLGSTWPPN